MWLAGGLVSIHSTHRIDAGYLLVSIYLAFAAVAACGGIAYYKVILGALRDGDGEISPRFCASMVRRGGRGLATCSELSVLFGLTAVATVPAALRLAWAPSLLLTVTLPLVVTYWRTQRARG